MPRNPLTLYHAFLEDAQEALGFPDPATTRSKLYSLLTKKPLDPRLTEVLNQHGLKAGYVRSHLLSIGSWSQEVQKAIEDGLPLKVARRVAALPAEEQAEALTPLYQPDPDDWATPGLQVERAARERLQPEPPPTSDGWTAPAHSPKRPQPPKGNTWILPDLTPLERKYEAFHPKVAEALLLTYAPRGGKVVDLTAGTGTVARVGHDLGYWVWSGDIEPQHDFIHEIDATDLELEHGLHAECATLVILHPPTYQAWRAQQDYPDLAVVENYGDFIAEMVSSAQPLLCKDGHLALISRPIRMEGQVHNSIGALIEVMETSFGKLKAYHLAVDQQGLDDWHVLVGQQSSRA